MIVSFNFVNKFLINEIWIRFTNDSVSDGSSSIDYSIILQISSHHIQFWYDYSVMGSIESANTTQLRSLLAPSPVLFPSSHYAIIYRSSCIFPVKTSLQNKGYFHKNHHWLISTILTKFRYILYRSYLKQSFKCWINNLNIRPKDGK